jgi:hypothetical protein
LYFILQFIKAFEEKSKALKAKDALIAELQGNLKQKEMENDVSGSHKPCSTLVVDYRCTIQS